MIRFCITLYELSYQNIYKKICLYEIGGSSFQGILTQDLLAMALGSYETQVDFKV